MDSVSICNLALMLVGIPAITSFQDENNNAKLCKTFFPVLRDRVLRDHTWSFATAFHELQRLDERSLDPKYDVVCPLPGDVIRVIELVENRPYRRIENKILVQELPATLVYTRRIEDPGLFDETFVEALQYLLAAEIGMSNTRDTQLIAMFRQEYDKRLALARSIDSQENRHAMQNAPKRSRWIYGRGQGAENYRPVKWTTGTEGKQQVD